jgi:transcription elongation factor Elf1
VERRSVKARVGGSNPPASAKLADRVAPEKHNPKCPPQVCIIWDITMGGKMSNIIYRECKHHGLVKFMGWNDNGKIHYHCYECNKEDVSNRRRELKKKAIEYKGGKCSICGYNKSVRSLVFHHLDPKEKDFDIGHSGYTLSWEKVKKELDKCILVCANCHGELEDEIEKNKP